MFKTAFNIGVLANYIIGAGMFALPYIALKVGFSVMLGYVLTLGFFVVVINLFYGELALSTPDHNRLPGFVKLYLGNIAENIAIILTVLSMFGALLVYLILAGDFLRELLSPIFGGGNVIYTLLLFSFSSTLIFFGRKAVFRGEFSAFILFVVILLLIFWHGLPAFRMDNLLIKTGDVNNLFLPYGAVLFSLWGLEIIPDIEETLGNNKSSLKKIIFFGSAIPILIYVFFIFIVLGISGLQTTESAIPGLKSFLGSRVISLALILGIITNVTSFNSLGLALKDVFRYDLKINKNTSWAIACFIPLFLFLLGMKNFIFVISFVGGLAMAFTGILVVLMYRKLVKNKKSKLKNFLMYSSIFVFLVGIVYEITYFVK